MIEDDKPDLIFGTETWLRPDINTCEVFPPNFVVYRRDRGKRGYGGILIAVNKDLVSEQLVINDCGCEVIAVKILSQGKSTILVSFYRPPNSGSQYMSNLCEIFRSICKDHTKSPIWIAGDMNLPDIDWATDSIISNKHNTKEVNECMLKLLETTNLEQQVTFPTRGNNILDILLTNRPSLVHRCRPLPGISDHDSIVHCEFNILAKHNRPVKRQIHQWRKADFNKIREEVRKRVSEFIETFSIATPIPELWKALSGIIKDIVVTQVPSKITSQRYSVPWVTQRCKHLSRKKKKLYRRAKTRNNDEAWAKFKLAKNICQKECREAYQKFVSDLVTEGGNSKRLWSFVKSMKTENVGVSPLTKDGVTYVDDKAKAAILNDQFCSVFSKNDPGSIPDLGDSSFSDMADIKISTQGVTKLLGNLKPHKASGPDGITTIFLKETAEEIAPGLSLVFQASINQGRIPDEWRTANVVPLFKKGDRSKACNYRPISLTSVCCKTLEHIIHTNIMKHLDYFSILTDYQHGFRKQRSCESQLLIAINEIAQTLDQGGQVDAVLLDFSKAFDKVSHSKLLQKLEHYGIRGSTQAWIRDFLRDRSQRVLVHGQSSASSAVTSGVPQGTVLGPLLFSVYINDLPSCVDSTPRLFADDCILYRVINTIGDCHQLQKDLDNLQIWEKMWSMEFNALKCEVIRITNRKSRIIHADYSIHNQQLAQVDSTKYLGISISRNLSWKRHVDITCQKANRTLAFLQRNIGCCPREIKTRCYQTYVRPILEYAAIVWSPYTKCDIVKLEAVQRRAARFVTGQYQRTVSVTGLLQQLQWQSLADRRLQARAVMLYRIVNGQVAVPLSLFTALPGRSATRGAATKFMVPRIRTCAYKATFVPSIIPVWNRLLNFVWVDIHSVYVCFR